MLAAGVGGQGDRLAGRRRKMAVESRVTQEEIKKEPEKPIDREKVRAPAPRASGPTGQARPGGGRRRRGRRPPAPPLPPADVPAAAPGVHHQQRPPPPHGRVLPRQRAVQRAADLHLVSAAGRGGPGRAEGAGRWGPILARGREWTGPTPPRVRCCDCFLILR